MCIYNRKREREREKREREENFLLCREAKQRPETKMNKNQSFDDFRGRDKNRTRKNIKRDRRKCWEDWWRNGWRAARSAKKHRKRYDFWRARRPKVFAFLLLSFDTTRTRLFKARRKLWWRLSVIPTCRDGSKRFNLFSLFLFFLLNAFDEREEAHRYHHPNAFSYAKTSSQHFFVHDE